MTDASKEPTQERSPQQDEFAVPAGPILSSRPDYYIQTSQEFDALMRAASDGETGRYWQTYEHAERRAHAVPGAPHSVLLELLPGESAVGATVETLEALTLAQNPDCNFALLYISRLLLPPQPLPDYARAAAWIDLDDVINKIGWLPETTEQRIAMREKVWRFILFGARARVVGRRTGVYSDKRTGKLIETTIDAPAWSIQEGESPDQPSLFPEFGNAPLRVQLVASETWTRITTSPDTAQYLPMGEVLGAIPAARASGAWARVIGLALANFWRRQPHAALDNVLKPTRTELLERYTPTIAPPRTILEGKNPQRAIDYWCDALAILVARGFVAPAGEAAISKKDMRASLSRKKWQEDWMTATVELHPGPIMQDTIIRIASGKPLLEPRPQIRKRGRPRKQPSTDS